MVISYAVKFAKNLKKHRKNSYSKIWYVDESYIKVKGKWNYLYRAINKEGEAIDFYLSKYRNTEFVKQFFQK